MFAHEHGELFLIILIVGANIDIFVNFLASTKSIEKAKLDLPKKKNMFVSISNSKAIVTRDIT